MEPAVRQYVIQPRVIHLSWWKKIALFFAISCFYFGFRWTVEISLHWEHQSTTRALIWAVGFGAYFAFRPTQRWFPRGGSLMIGDDFIESRTLLRWSQHRKRIAREKIKSISQNRRGCVLWIGVSLLPGCWVLSLFRPRCPSTRRSGQSW